jgi:L-lactate utilization protein LutC
MDSGTRLSGSGTTVVSGALEGAAMTTSREGFLERVRRAVEAGKRVGRASALERRGTTGYQGAGPDPATHFCEELSAAGGHAHRVADAEAAVAELLEIVQRKAARRIAIGHKDLIHRLRLRERLTEAGVEIITTDALSPENSRDPLFTADLGISVADYLIAETGSVALLARLGEPRSLSLLPPIHVVLAERTQVVADLFDLFEPKRLGEPPILPSCFSLITGPSKTGDIELRLVTGVHGPGEIHVILIDA